MQISKLNVAMMPVAKVLAVAETLREGDKRMKHLIRSKRPHKRVQSQVMVKYEPT